LYWDKLLKTSISNRRHNEDVMVGLCALLVCARW